tara:strand:- start:62856 stop:64733 length:1878 start_codon:yes stop_codon:yes gene_type:complete
MIRGIETVKAVKDLSQTGYKKNIYALDHYGFINVLCIDDFSRDLYALGLSQSYIDLIGNLMHANLVYGLSKEIGVMPGLFKASDDALKAYLLSRVSDAVEARHKNQVVLDLISAWNDVATHPEAEKQHMLAGQKKDSLVKISDFTRFVYYKPFVDSLFSMILNTWSDKSPKQFIFFYTQFVELFYSPLTAKALCFNQFYNLALLQDRMKDGIRFSCLEARSRIDFREALTTSGIDFDEHNFQYSAHPDIFAAKVRHHPIGKHFKFVSEYLAYIRRECRTHIGGWAGFELSGLEEKYSPELLNPALLNLLEGNVPVSSNHDLRSELESLVQKIASPQGHDAELIAQVFKDSDPIYTEIVEPQKVQLTYQALLDAVLAFVAEHKIKLQYSFPWPEEFRYLAASEEEILAQLLQCLSVFNQKGQGALSEREAFFLRPEVLFSIQQTASSVDIQDIILRIIQSHLQEQKHRVAASNTYFSSFSTGILGSMVGRTICPLYALRNNAAPLIAAAVVSEPLSLSRASTSRLDIEDSATNNIDLASILDSSRSARPMFSTPLVFSSSGVAATIVRRRMAMREAVEPFELVLQAINGTWQPVCLEQDAEAELAESLDQLSLGERSQRPKSWFGW